MTMTEIQNLLNELMRGIDKKTVLTVEPSKDTNRSGVTVRLSRNRRSRSVEIAETDLVAGQSDLMHRNNLRSTLKRARDAMWAQTGYIFDTKMINHQPEGANHWSRPSQGGRGGGRR